ncbi:MAG: hypothetical protein MZV64_64025 [Ignavibacteriales bacterium]|nr:hypothetical protein [Ignavibacteriales bacterium]
MTPRTAGPFRRSRSSLEKSAHPVASSMLWSFRSPGSRPAPTTSTSTPRTGSPGPWPGRGRR